MLLVIILLILLLGGGGAYSGYHTWGAYGGGGISIGTILVIALVVLLVRGDR